MKRRVNTLFDVYEQYNKKQKLEKPGVISIEKKYDDDDSIYGKFN